MRRNLFIGFVAILFAIATIFIYWDNGKMTLDCSSQNCAYTRSDIFDNNKRMKEFAIDEVISCDEKTYQRKGRKGRTYTSTDYFITTTTQKIYINKDFYEIFKNYYKNPAGELHLCKYSKFEFIFVIILSIIGLFNFITFFKPININFNGSDIAKKIEEEGLVGLLFNKK